MLPLSPSFVSRGLFKMRLLRISHTISAPFLLNSSYSPLHSRLPLQTAYFNSSFSFIYVLLRRFSWAVTPIQHTSFVISECFRDFSSSFEPRFLRRKGRRFYIKISSLPSRHSSCFHRNRHVRYAAHLVINRCTIYFIRYRSFNSKTQYNFGASSGLDRILILFQYSWIINKRIQYLIDPYVSI